MKIDVISIFPGYLEPLQQSLLGKAQDAGLIEISVHDLRRWTHDVHHTVDDAPYGGGPGMVMRADIWGAALDEVTALPWDHASPAQSAQVSPVGVLGPEAESASAVLTATSSPAPGDPAQARDAGGAHEDAPRVPILIVPTPSGEPFTQQVAEELAAAHHLVFACGRYEGIDARVMRDAARRMPVRELSIGDYVLAGGEVATLVMVEAITRLIPGVLGNADSVADDSFAGALTGLVEGPVYTRPATYRGLAVPDVLAGGNHAAIARHRRDESLRRTAEHRPDLLARLIADQLDAADYDVLAEVGARIPAGLAERVAQERAAADAKKRRKKRRSGPAKP